MGDPKMSPQQEDLISPWPLSIQNHLEKAGAAYKIVPHNRTVTLSEAVKESGLKSEHLIRGVMLQDSKGILMAIIPADRLLDFSALCALLGREELSPVKADKLREIFKDCEPGSYPPLPQIYHLETIIDDAVFALPSVIFEPGIHEILLEMTQIDFQKVQGSMMQGNFSERLDYLAKPKDPSKVTNIVDKFIPARMKTRTEETFELPSLPPIANEILRLRVDPDADAKKLAAIIEKDPSLAAQLISWARSPFYGYAGTVQSIECAIVKVLGFDLVMNLALGIVVGKAMRVPTEGPLGLKEYWKFSLFTACIIEKLVKQMPASTRPPRGLAYLAGLLHNFGHLILGEVFPPQFFILNRYVSVNPHFSISSIEQHVLGVRHEQIGAWLMQAWHMPKEIIAAVKWHHQGEFVDEHKTYPNLVLVAIRLLHSIGVGDAATSDIPNAILESLGLTSAQTQLALEELVAHEAELLSVANQLSK